MKTVRVLLLGDLVGVTGRAMLAKHIEQLRKDLRVDALIVNGENSAHGRGITPKIVEFYKQHGVDVITSGNHIWQRKPIYEYLNNNTDLLRPANFPDEAPGVGVTTFSCKGHEIGVINIQGRIFMREHLACPFRKVQELVKELYKKTKVIFVDFHAEATSEKMGMGFFLDGQVSAVVGTHTHIQTADERILPNGTAYITDLGMGGSLNSMIGMQKEAIITHFLTQIPVRFAVDTAPPGVMSGVCVEVDVDTGRALQIERVRIIDPELEVTGTE